MVSREGGEACSAEHCAEHTGVFLSSLVVTTDVIGSHRGFKRHLGVSLTVSDGRLKVRLSLPALTAVQVGSPSLPSFSSLAKASQC